MFAMLSYPSDFSYFPLFKENNAAHARSEFRPEITGDSIYFDIIITCYFCFLTSRINNI